MLGTLLALIKLGFITGQIPLNNFLNTLLLLTSFYSFTALAEDCSILMDSCDYYHCRESLNSCGEKGYYAGFASKYCRESQNELSQKVTDAGKVWIKKVTLCLKQNMEKIPVLETCKEVFNKAVDDHSVCYTQSGFCSLPFKDKVQIIDMLKKEFVHRKIILEGLQVIDECLK